MNGKLCYSNDKFIRIRSSLNTLADKILYKMGEKEREEARHPSSNFWICWWPHSMKYILFGFLVRCLASLCLEFCVLVRNGQRVDWKYDLKLREVILDSQQAIPIRPQIPSVWNSAHRMEQPILNSELLHLGEKMYALLGLSKSDRHEIQKWRACQSYNHWIRWLSISLPFSSIVWWRLQCSFSPPTWSSPHMLDYFQNS